MAEIPRRDYQIYAALRDEEGLKEKVVVYLTHAELIELGIDPAGDAHARGFDLRGALHKVKRALRLG